MRLRRLCRRTPASRQRRREKNRKAANPAKSNWNGWRFLMTAQQQFEGFLRKYQPGVAAEAKKALVKLRKLIPNAVEMVYDKKSPNEQRDRRFAPTAWRCITRGKREGGPEETEGPRGRVHEELFSETGNYRYLFCWDIAGGPEMDRSAAAAPFTGDQTHSVAQRSEKRKCAARAGRDARLKRGEE